MSETRIRDLERECTRLRGLLKGYAGGAVIDELARMDRALADAQRWRQYAEDDLAVARRERDECRERNGDVINMVTILRRTKQHLEEGTSLMLVLAAVADAARAYRAAETDGTPRMWRGKGLQDLANALDEALARLEPPPSIIQCPKCLVARPAAAHHTHTCD